MALPVRYFKFLFTMQSLQATMQGPPSHAAPTATSSSGRLKYANPRDLPSFPSLGLRQNDAAASAAASLGWANQKPATNPADQKSQNNLSSASAVAALLAKGHRTAPQSPPARTDVGSRAAVLAASRKPDAPSTGSTPSSSNWGSSAANQAFRANSTKGLAAPGSREIGPDGSLRAAKDAMGRPRAFSSPGPKEAAHHLTESRSTNALTAATMAHKRTTTADFNKATSSANSPSFMNMNRQMFTSNPPVKTSADEQKHNDVLHASAVAMAKRIYNNQQQKQQQQQRDADSAAKLAQSGVDSNSPDTSSTSTPQFTNLQEAAYKLAQERLSKLQEEHDRTRNNQEYYGASSPVSYRRFMPKNKLRRRSSSDGVAMYDAEHKPRRATMHAVYAPRQHPAPAAVDEHKRQRDREALLSAARRNVRVQLDGIDRKVQAETGMVSPSMQADWEAKARAIARARSHPEFMIATMPDGNAPGTAGNASGNRATPKDKVDIGGGRYMDQAEIDEIAARKVQPFLDEINEKAEKEHQRLAALKAEQDAKREAEELERSRQREVKELHEKIKGQQKDQDKARKEEIKHEGRQRKRLGKEAKMEQKRDPKASQQHRLFLTKTTDDDQINPQQTAESSSSAENTGSIPKSPESKKERSRRGRSLHIRLPSIPLASRPKDKEKGKGREREPRSASAALSSDAQSPTEESSPTSAKVRNWLKSRFRPRARSSVEPGSHDSQSKSGAFIGGAALAAQHQRAASDGSRTSIKEESLREVALAGRDGGGVGNDDQTTLARTTTGVSSVISGQQPPRPGGATSVVSLPSTALSNESSLSVSSSSSSGIDGGGEHFVLARDHLSPTMGPVATAAVLPLPPKIRDPTLRATKSGSPVRDSRFLEMIDS